MTALLGAHAVKSAVLAMWKGCVQLRPRYRLDPVTAAVSMVVRLGVVIRETLCSESNDWCITCVSSATAMPVEVDTKNWLA